MRLWGRIISYILDGKPITETPKDLFIPPDALEILLDLFTGPLDLLLYLIRREHIDIMDIPMLRITQQYMQYIDLMESTRMELAVDYLVMAAMLAEIKSRMLLPITTRNDDGEDIDPRMELVRRLQVYEQFKQAAMRLEQLPRRGRDVFPVEVPCFNLPINTRLPDMKLDHLVLAMKQVLERQGHVVHHQIQREPLSVHERMAHVLQRLQDEEVLEFTTLYQQHEGRMGLVVSFLAILELAKQALLLLIQTDAFMPIYIRTRQHDG
ncbi:MAG: ScpA family protein [Legionellaceae bacterium]|nr:ScpA family protein [Legionellaceae bacterium]